MFLTPACTSYTFAAIGEVDASTAAASAAGVGEDAEQVVLVPCTILTAGHTCSLATSTNRQSLSQLQALPLVM